MKTTAISFAFVLAKGPISRLEEEEKKPKNPSYLQMADRIATVSGS